MFATLQNWLHCQAIAGLLVILICSLKFLVTSASIACAYAEMLSEYFTGSFISSMENTATNNDHMKQVETSFTDSLKMTKR